MSPSPARILAPALAAALACTAHTPESTPLDPATRRASLARTLAIELAPAAGGVAPDGPALWLSPTSFALVVDERVDLHDIDPEPSGPVDPALALGAELHDLLAIHPTSLDLYVDRRVTADRLAHVLDAATRARRAPLRLIGGTPERPAGITVEAGPAFSDHPDARPPFGRLAADLIVRWGEHGVTASARPRPADRDPFALDRKEPAPGDEPEPDLLPELVPLRAVAGPAAASSLDPAALARITTDLCILNAGPLGVSLAPALTTDHAALMTVAAAVARPCVTVLRIRPGRHDPEPGPAITVAALRTRLDALTRDHGVAR